MIVLLLLSACGTGTVDIPTSATVADVDDLTQQIATLTSQVETLTAQVEALDARLENESSEREDGDALQQQDINDLKDAYAALALQVAELANGTTDTGSGGGDTGSGGTTSRPTAWFSEELVGTGTRWEPLSEVEITTTENVRLLGTCEALPIAADAVQQQLILLDEGGDPIEGSNALSLTADSGAAPGMVVAYAFDVEPGSYTIACYGSSSRGFTSSWTSVIEAQEP